MIFASIVSIPLLLLHPNYIIFAIIIVTASFIDYSLLPLIPFLGIGSVNITDVLLLGALAFTFGKKFYYKIFYNRQYPFVRTPLDTPIALFLLLCVIVLIYSLWILKAEFHNTFRMFRYFSYYLLFFTITNLARDRKDLSRFIWGVVYIACLTSFVCLIQQVLGISSPLIAGRVEALETMGVEYSQVTRLVPNGIHVIYISFIPLICLLVSERFQGKTILLYSGIVLLALSLIFAYYRSLWISTLLALFLFFSVTTGRQRVKIILWGLIGIWGFLIIFLYSINANNKLTNIILASQDRILSVFRITSLKGTGADTLKDRAIENQVAWENILTYPIFGVGWGPSIHMNKLPKIWAGWFVLKRTYLSIHNSILDLLMHLGLVGFSLYAWVSLLFLLRGFRNWKKIKDPFLQAVCISFTVGYVGIIVNSFVEPFFHIWRGIIPISILWGTNEAIYKVEGIEGKK